MKNREQWLTRGAQLLAPIFRASGLELPPEVRISVGFPCRGALSLRNRVIGQCFGPKASTDGVPQLYVSPLLAEPVQVLDVVTHELIHAVVGVEHGHRGPFRRAAVAVGLEGKMTATVAGAELAVKLRALTDRLGPYPHAELSPSSNIVKKQTTRMLKAECECGCIIRMTRRWIEETGLPTCACGGEFKEAL